ncbi:PAS-domain containing protein [Curvibacter sp. APW13]|uniref:PAS-domain containing protein n=1 Tax=Curvibacter sp. APW13 TaxID=3077236 RepID=UPI0028E091BF|nr:PAS-domain containing protein [Curvibacter sp. APW13]MDT8991221.1 PAS-domain containing protein [Curvibacter sp. APW13]
MDIGTKASANWELLLAGLDLLDIGFTVVDAQLCLVAANRRFQELLNYPDYLLVPGTSNAEGFRYLARRGEYGPGDVEEQVRARMELAARFQAHRFERVRPDGVILEVVGNPLPGGGMVTTYTDVTVPRHREQALKELSEELERKVEERTAQLVQREQELAKKAALLELVLNSVNQGISFVNQDLVLEMCNRRFGELMQLPPELTRPGARMEDMGYHNARRGEYGPGDIDELVRQRIELARKALPHHFERTRPTDGVTLEVIGTPTPDGGMVTTYTDISERKAAELHIHDLNESLEQRVHDRTQALEKAMERLQHLQEELAHSSTRAALSALTASVAHELSTPLGNSLMAATTCEDAAKRITQRLQGEGLRKSELTAFVQEIREGSALTQRNLFRAVEMVSKLKQVGADQVSEQRRRFDAGQTVAEVLDTLRPSLKHRSQRLVPSLAPGVWMDSYPGALGQIVINLVNNAFLHAFEGRTQGQVEVVLRELPGQQVELVVADDGVGMSVEVRERIFQPFFSTKIGQGGTGLGTSIVEELVKKTLGGSVTLETRQGEGTRFSLIFPMVAPAAPSLDR